MHYSTCQKLYNIITYLHVEFSSCTQLYTCLNMPLRFCLETGTMEFNDDDNDAIIYVIALLHLVLILFYYIH